MDPFIEANPEWCLEQGIITKEEYGAIVNPSEETAEPETVEETVTTSGTSSLGSDDSVIVVNGKTYTKSELEAALKNL